MKLQQSETQNGLVPENMAGNAFAWEILDGVMMKKSIRLLILISLCMFLHGCDLFNDDEGSPAPFSTIAQGTSSGFTQKAELVIMSADEWRTLWDQHQSIRSPAEPLPQIDFASHVVIAIFAGNKPSSGYEVEVKDVSSRN